MNGPKKRLLQALCSFERGDTPQFLDERRHNLYDPVNFGLLIVAAEGKSYGTVNGGRGNTHCPQDMTRLKSARGAGRPR